MEMLVLSLLHFSAPEFISIAMIAKIAQGLIGDKTYLLHSALKSNLYHC
jgi:hypothetical protein